METITAAAIIHQAAKLYIEYFEERSAAATITTAANLEGKMQSIMDMVLALGLNVTDVILETRRIYAEEAAR